jgi:DNA polymerase I-like protein with 3'-5' exonuclease and polymerase domains
MLVGHTHDEIIIECDKHMAEMVGDVLRQEMEAVPEWLPGFPLDCEISTADRYGKQPATKEKAPGV